MISAGAAQANEIAYVIVGTAGHIDHGKSSLVKYLTGEDPDRFPEEKERGITIDIGYAGRVLPDGRNLGFIDVPGHERFIKNMVAGATSVDVTLLVVAADDGVMPQTREHLAILQLLGMKHLLVALTKSDLVDADMLELAVEDVRAFLAGTPFADVPIIPCSTLTGAGCDELWHELVAIVGRVSERSKDGIFRMPVQRSFSAKGFGTVVTGVPLGGTVAVGDLLEVLPGAKRGKVRGLQAHGVTLERAGAGHRTAINLADVDLKQVERGMVVATPGVLRPSSYLAVSFEALADLEEGVGDGDLVRFHVGTAEIIGEVALLEGKPIPPGGTGLIQLVLHQPAVAVPGDRYILRRHSPMLTLGGGIVLRLDERRLKRRRDWILDDLEARRHAIGDAAAFVRYLLERADEGCVAPDDLVREVAVSRQLARELLGAKVRAGECVQIAPDLVSLAGTLRRVRGELIACVERFHSEHPERFRLEIATLKRELGRGEAVIDHCLAALVAAGTVVVEQGACRLAVLPEASAELAAQRSRIAEIFRDRAFDAPRTITLTEELGWPPAVVAAHLQYLTDSGQLVRIAEDLHIHKTTAEQTLAQLKGALAADGELDTGAFKERLAVSRKLLIPLLEYYDRIGVTYRDGNKRFLRSSRRSE